MKKLVLAALVSLAAAGPSAAADFLWMPAYNWAGFYVGAHVGANINNTVWTFAPLDSGASSVGGAPGTGMTSAPKGFIGGGQFGLNLQYGSIVLGAEIAGDGTAVRMARSCSPGSVSVCRTRSHFFGTATGRLGFAWGRALVYAKGGFALIDDDYQRARAGSDGVASATRAGWIIGAGVEYAMLDGLSLLAEYNYMDFGSERYSFVTGTGVTTDNITINQTTHVVKLGFNFRLLAGPNSMALRY